MSEYYKFYCEVCESYSEYGENHGDRSLLALLEAYPLISKLLDVWNKNRFLNTLTIEVSMSNFYSIIEWLDTHFEHGPVVVSEYWRPG